MPILILHRSFDMIIYNLDLDCQYLFFMRRNRCILKQCFPNYARLLICNLLVIGMQTFLQKGVEFNKSFWGSHTITFSAHEKTTSLKKKKVFCCSLQIFGRLHAHCHVIHLVMYITSTHQIHKLC